MNGRRVPGTMAVLGGTFLASHDPARLMDWFSASLGIVMDRHGDGGSTTFPAGHGVAVLAVMRARPDAPRPPAGAVEREPYGRQPMMLNVRVDDMAEALERLRSQGDVVEGPATYAGQGTFAWTRTPDGHDVELWRP